MLMRANQIHLSVASDGTLYATPVSKAGAVACQSGEEYPGMTYWGDPVEFPTIEAFLRDAKLEQELDDGTYYIPMSEDLQSLVETYRKVMQARCEREEAARNNKVVGLNESPARLTTEESKDLLGAVAVYLDALGLAP